MDCLPEEQLAIKALMHFRLGSMTIDIPVGEVIKVDGITVTCIRSADHQYSVKTILDHRYVGLQLEFLTVYEGFEMEAPTWQPVQDFADGQSCNVVAQQYCVQHGVRLLF
jgi:hypothetical protein